MAADADLLIGRLDARILVAEATTAERLFDRLCFGGEDADAAAAAAVALDRMSLRAAALASKLRAKETPR